ncbi:MAG: phosphate signaling complex protein PhoU [bacterium]
MSKHLHRDLDLLKKEILEMGSLVEKATRKSIEALEQRDAELAREVIEGDDLLDAKEVEVEEECLKVLALHQPVAADLRFIVTVLKVNNDLERMGDLAKNIAERSLDIVMDRKNVPPQLREMADRVQGMVTRSLDALVRMDPWIARAVLGDDDAIDELNGRIHALFRAEMEQDSGRVANGISLLLVSRHLERIADQATNIAEDVIFTVEGDLVRHRRWAPVVVGAPRFGLDRRS